jgi:hypothetical protein
MTSWTEASDEVKQFCVDHPDLGCDIDYIEAENKKRWTFKMPDKTKIVFEQYFDFGFFKNIS